MFIYTRKLLYPSIFESLARVLVIFLQIEFLSVFDIHDYELLKFVFRAVAKFFLQTFLNDQGPRKQNCLQNPYVRKKIDQFSIRFRATKIFSLLWAQKMYPRILKDTRTELVKFYNT